jgi:hypothetical protein
MLGNIEARYKAFLDGIVKGEPYALKPCRVSCKSNILRRRARIEQTVSHRIKRICRVDPLVLKYNEMHRAARDVASLEKAGIAFFSDD